MNQLMTSPLVELINVSRHFPMEGGPLRILDDITLSVHRGEMVGIVGASGAGKSTLMQIVGALDRPTGGTVRFDGKEVFTRSSKELAKFRTTKIGFIFQAHMLLPEFSAMENVALAAMINGHARTDAFSRASRMLDQVGLSRRVDHRPGKLSGGEQQRVAIARALINKPELILADEPTGNLDTGTGEEVFELLVELNKNRNETFLVVTHNLALAAKMDRVISIKDGKVC
jgi:lipoprotein-releasing system ATP-binding protein